MDKRNFNFLKLYSEEQVKDQNNVANIRKYLYEFQESIDNFKLMGFQNKLREQLCDNFALFNEFNPAYISLNLGRKVSRFKDEGIPQEQFKFILREAQVIGNVHMVINFLSFD